MDFSKVSRRIAAEHPEWCYVSPTGQSQSIGDLVSVCPSGGYYQEKSFAAVDEVMDRYPVDGFFFNWFGFNEIDYSKVYNGVCHCLSCQRAFHAYSGGADLPAGPASSTYGVWRTFSAATIANLTDRLRARIAARRPNAFLLGRTADVIFHEANNALGRQLNLPPTYLLIHRVTLGGIGVLCQLGTAGPFRAEMAQWVPGFLDD